MVLFLLYYQKTNKYIQYYRQKLLEACNSISEDYTKVYLLYSKSTYQDGESFKTYHYDTNIFYGTLHRKLYFIAELKPHNQYLHILLLP